ncbi:MAG: 2-oxoglutarate dehydrogenase E1 component [Chitinophagales bacterium]|nr:2-oxoglutarate dehydrogenase E1 component [Chitinophagaceae bacterium]MCB9065034.1 2-oxoglutarate dehydrogenase E1 component [Chitinophagales bacterium]
MKDFSYVMSSHPSYIEELYDEFVKNPTSVDDEWKKFFEGFDFAYAKLNGNGAVATSDKTPISNETLQKELSVYKLIRAFRKRGHLIATTNPIRQRKDRHARLDLANFGLSEADLETEFQTGKHIGLGTAKLKDIYAKLKKVYGGNVGIEYTYINDQGVCEWVEREFQEMMDEELPIEKKKRILEKLNEGVMFEEFLHKKYIGQKRFSLEGGESTIPALDTIINSAAETGVQEVVIGMAHRGRLNVLANTLKKTYEQIFSEFEGNMPPDTTMGSGDVKYHLGFRSDIMTPNGKAVNVQLTPNPSHLEVVDPVVTGFARAKADAVYNSEYDNVLPILIHGDSAVAGQGVVYELLQMSKLEGYYTGGTIHFIINNQIGFTTDFDDARSANYCTSVASMVQAPVLHVNGDDPEAVVKACEIAVQFRQKYHQDMFIDMVCYRKHGHNEGDDPSFTQPHLYELIKKHKNPRETYTQYLLDKGESDAKKLAKDMETRYWDELQKKLDEVKEKPLPYNLQDPEKAWKTLRHSTPEDFDKSPNTAVSKKELDTLFNDIMAMPKGFQPLRKIKKLLDDKVKLYKEQGKLDWATGELLGYASLVKDGNTVRMSGQDVERGTFSHRHAVLHDANTYEKYNRLSKVSDNPNAFMIYNSLLSEFAVLGFEYGYSIATPNSLTIWEAQFGDFANGAQTVIDQYIVSAEAKWRKMSGMVMLLPHGYEGQGPEHSSARLERFLQLCAQYNIVVTNITTSANLFHMFRRQLAWEFRKPLVNFSPKANLRHTGAYSSIEDFTKGGFKEVIDDETVKTPTKVKRVLLCSGKVYFDLHEKRENEKRSDLAIVRLEQLYPLPHKQLNELKKKYKNAEWAWVQEEPRNMGAGGYLFMTNEDFTFDTFVTRPASAASATGFSKIHAKEQEALLNDAFHVK